MTTETIQTPATEVITEGDKGVAGEFQTLFQDTALRDFVVNKGWTGKDGHIKALTGYQQLEALRGVPAERLLTLPKDGDAEAEKAFRKALGVPETPDKYDFKFDDGTKVNEDFLKVAKGWFHEAGVPPKQAAILAAKWAAYGGEAQKTADATRLQTSQQGFDELKKEWGNTFDANAAATQRAFGMVAKPAGLDTADLDKIEDAIGPQKMMKMFAAFGNMVSEARFVDGKGPTGGFTPEAARARMEALGKDKEWFGKFTKGDVGAVQEWQALQRAAAAGLESAA